MERRKIDQLLTDKNGDAVGAAGLNWGEISVQDMNQEIKSGQTIYYIEDKRGEFGGKDLIVYCDPTEVPGKVIVKTEPPSLQLLNLM